MLAHLLPWLIGSAVTGYFWQGYLENRWWTSDYMASLSIPFLGMIGLCWFILVPRRLEYDDDRLLIHSWWKGEHAYSWDELRFYGGGYGVFLLQFGSSQAFQIFNLAYAKSDWKPLRDFLRERYPEKKASGWIGPFGFRWRK